ncbi:TIGR04283 family arsenosugar biosynthesis glycosyltransferase [Beggiatoa alba]|nr:TIGR04283 family arsenosugar biosynthesis glycosyltransferase [Beggiatoa alba]
MASLSIIIPTLNEAASIYKTLSRLRVLKSKGHEIIIVDGGSTDKTLSICKQFTDKIFVSEKGRAMQMNLGAKLARNDILVFLHADTLLPDNVDMLISQALKHSRKQWGRFNIKLSGAQLVLRVIEVLINIRSFLSGIATGDQTIFVTKGLFKRINGFREIPLMEDIELSKSLKRYSRPLCLNAAVITSSRRWETNGYFKTILLMWKLRLLYFLGVSPKQLVKLYYH